MTEDEKLDQAFKDQDVFSAAAAAHRDRSVEVFKDYCMLLATMTPQQLAIEIGGNCPVPKLAAILTHMAQRIIILEERLNEHG